MNTLQDNHFQAMLRQMEQAVQEDNEAFIKDPDNHNRIRLINPKAIFKREPSELEQRMIHRIQMVDDYSWNRGKDGGLNTGFESFNEAIEGGLQPGLILFAAAPNAGKSAFMLQLMKQTAELNENVYCEYHSLDDSIFELMPRWIACDQRITIGQAKSPEKYENSEEIMERRNEGLKNLYRLSSRFSMLDQEEAPPTIEELEDHIKKLKMTLPDNTKIVLGIDSFYDLKTSKNFGNNDRKEIEHIARTVKSYAQAYDITIMCTAHLRKSGQKRPINDDLKESNTIEYEANLLCLLYNEVGVKEEAADIYWYAEDVEFKMPVLEMRFSKNKFSDFKGTRFFEFVPAQSYFMEATEEATKRYASLVYQS